MYHLNDARQLVNLKVDVIAHSVRDGKIDDLLLAKMKQQGATYIPTLSLDDFAFADGATPWIDDPSSERLPDQRWSRWSPAPNTKEKARIAKSTSQEEAALPMALRT